MVRALVVVGLFCACTGHGQTPPPADSGPHNNDPSNPPDGCGCVTERPPVFGECCDSVVCSFNDETNRWDITICDALPPDPCDQCAIGAGEICVQSYDGACGLTTACVTETVQCPDNACSLECEAAYCSSPLQCQNRAPCGTESPFAFTCYGP